MKESSKRRDIRAPFHDKVHIIKPLLQTTGMILFFSLVLLSFRICDHSSDPSGNLVFQRMCPQTEEQKSMGTDHTVQGVHPGSVQFSEGWICRGKCIFGEQRGHKDALWRTLGNVL